MRSVKLASAYRLRIIQLIFPKLPASLIYKITRSNVVREQTISQVPEQGRLALVIEYSCLDEGMRCWRGTKEKY